MASHLSMSLIQRPQLSHQAKTAQRQTSSKPTSQTCMDGDGLPRVSHAWGAEAACQSHCLPEQGPWWNQWGTCCRSDNAPTKPTYTTWVSAGKVQPSPTPSLPQGTSTTVPPSPVFPQEGDNSLLLVAFTGSQSFRGDWLLCVVQRAGQWEEHHGGGGHGGQDLRPTASLPTAQLCSQAAAFNSKALKSSRDCIAGKGSWHSVVFLLKEPTMTPQCATLCNSRRAAGQNLSHVMFRTCPLFQDTLERIHPVVFSKTKSLFIFLTETAKN